MRRWWWAIPLGLVMLLGLGALIYFEFVRPPTTETNRKAVEQMLDEHPWLKIWIADQKIEIRYVENPLIFGYRGWSYLPSRTVVIPVQANSEAAYTAMFEIGHHVFSAHALAGKAIKTYQQCIASHAFAQYFVDSDGHLGVDREILWTTLDLSYYRQPEACEGFIEP